MKKIVYVLIIFFILINLTSCNLSETPERNFSEIDKNIYFSTNGYMSAVDDNYLVVQDLESLKVIDLVNKKTIKTISIPNKQVLGFDINEGKIVWSDLRNEQDSSKIKDYMETANADIFMYEIKTDKLTQITNNSAPQINPKIWKNYIVWQDNRNDNKVDIYPKWEIYLYDINTGEEKQITTAPGIHTNPSINEDRVVWEDGRTFR